MIENIFKNNIKINKNTNKAFLFVDQDDEKVVLLNPSGNEVFFALNEYERKFRNPNDLEDVHLTAIQKHQFLKEEDQTVEVKSALVNEADGAKKYKDRIERFYQSHPDSTIALYFWNLIHQEKQHQQRRFKRTERKDNFFYDISHNPKYTNRDLKECLSLGNWGQKEWLEKSLVQAFDDGFEQEREIERLIKMDKKLKELKELEKI